jgi:hypothetical protein
LVIDDERYEKLGIVASDLDADIDLLPTASEGEDLILAPRRAGTSRKDTQMAVLGSTLAFGRFTRRFFIVVIRLQESRIRRHVLDRPCDHPRQRCSSHAPLRAADRQHWRRGFCCGTRGWSCRDRRKRAGRDESPVCAANTDEQQRQAHEACEPDQMLPQCTFLHVLISLVSGRLPFQRKGRCKPTPLGAWLHVTWNQSLPRLASAPGQT